MRRQVVSSHSSDFLDYALSQFQKRLARLERARALTPDQVMADFSDEVESGSGS